MNEYDTIKAMVLDAMQGHPNGIQYSYLKTEITTHKLLHSHLVSMEDEGLIYRPVHSGRVSLKFKLTRKAKQL